MLKKIMFCSFGVVFLLGSGDVLFAKEKPQFSIAPQGGKVVQLPEGVQPDLRNAAELTPEEFRAAIEQSSCTNAAGEKSPTACYACTGLDCTGTCYEIPCGFYINAAQQVPPVAGFSSFATGCTTTYVSPCADFGCETYQFDTATWGDDVCINSNAFLLQSVGCI